MAQASSSVARLNQFNFLVYNILVYLFGAREPSDRELDQQDWDEDIEDEICEMREKADEEYQQQLDEFNVKHRLWQEQKKRKVVSELKNCKMCDNF